MMALAEQRHFAWAISFHTIGTAIFTPYNAARAVDGRFDRVVVGPGKYTVTVRADGHAPVRKKVRVRSKPVELAIALG